MTTILTKTQELLKSFTPYAESCDNYGHTSENQEVLKIVLEFKAKHFPNILSTAFLLTDCYRILEGLEEQLVQEEEYITSESSFYDLDICQYLHEVIENLCPAMKSDIDKKFHEVCDSFADVAVDENDYIDFAGLKNSTIFQYYQALTHFIIKRIEFLVSEEN